MKNKRLIILVSFLLSSCSYNNLPIAEQGSGIRGEQFGIDKNINESTIDNYLFRDDVVYRDMRMLDDPADYSKINGESLLIELVECFEIVPLPYIIKVEGLPSEVGNTYQGDTLFYKDEDGNYQPNYEESLSIIHSLFPKDKAIFLMCGGGGYASMTKDFLINLGYNKYRIYNTGGFWFYEGNHKVKADNPNVIYHEINKFETYTKIK